MSEAADALLQLLIQPPLRHTEWGLRRSLELGIFGHLHAALRRGEPDDIPAWAREARRQLALTAARRRRESAALMELLEGRGYPAAILKGAALDVLLHGGAYRRLSSDIDLLIRLEDRSGVLQALAEAGYQQLGAVQDRYKDVPLQHPDWGSLVELHWSIATPDVPGIPTPELLQRRVPVDLGGEAPGWTIEAADHLLVLALHFHAHCGWVRPLMDIAAWIDRFGAQQDVLAQVARRARRHGLRGIHAWPMLTLEALGVAPPRLLIEEARDGANPLCQVMTLCSAPRYRGVLQRAQPLPQAAWPMAKMQLPPSLLLAYRLPRALALDDPGDAFRMLLDVILLSGHQREALAATGRDSSAADYALALLSRPGVWARRLMADLPGLLTSRRLESHGAGEEEEGRVRGDGGQQVWEER